MENQENKIKLLVTKFNEAGKEVTNFVDEPIETLTAAAKSLAGSLFHQDTIRSVCVVDMTGTALLYMNKTADRSKWVGVE